MVVPLVCQEMPSHSVAQYLRTNYGSNNRSVSLYWKGELDLEHYFYLAEEGSDRIGSCLLLGTCRYPGPDFPDIVAGLVAGLALVVDLAELL